MTRFKLIYFDLRGRAELARLIFHYAGQEFEDHRLGYGEGLPSQSAEWLAIKTQMPFLQVPVLEVDGELVTQSHTIARYLARRFKLAGRSEIEEAQADAYVDHIYDLITAMGPLVRQLFVKDADERVKELSDKFITETLDPHLLMVEKRIEENGSGYLVGQDLTWADIAYYSFLSWVETFKDPLFEKTPLVKALIDRVANIPNIKKYVEARPKTLL